jgi:predicted dinucleotide-binding enzyme
MFIAGNDADAKKTVTGFLTAFKWNTHDLGGLEQSRIPEYFAMLWITYGFRNSVWNHAFRLVRK